LLQLNDTERTVLACLWRQDGLSRARITALTKLSKATISRVVNQLMEKRLLIEQGVESRKTRGRPSTPLTLDGNSRSVGGVNIRSNCFDVSLGDLSGRIKDFFSIGHGRTDVEEGLVALPERIAERGVELDRLVSFSIVTPGIVERATASVTNAFYTGGGRVSLGEKLGPLDCPVTVENDANSLIYSEILFGRVRETDILYIDKGFGSSLVIDGRVFRGPHGSAGELGHLQLDPHGPICWCGKRGCLSAYFAKESLMERFSFHLNESHLKQPERALLGVLSQEYAVSSDRKFAEVFERLLDLLGAAIANVVDFLGVETVVLNNQNPVYNSRTFDYLRNYIFTTAIKRKNLKFETVTVSTERLMLVPLAVALSALLEKQEV